MSKYLIQSVYYSLAGYAVTVQIEEEGAAELREHLISEELWTREMRPTPGTVLTEEEYVDMAYCASLSRARARAREILSYAGQSRGALVQKLRHYDLPDDICEETADWAIREKLLNERTQALFLAENYPRRKYWGRRRIAADLQAKGYTAEVIAEAVDAVSDEDYARALQVLIEKKFGRIPADPAERQKMVLSLLRLGYTGQEIKDAMTALLSGAEV